MKTEFLVDAKHFTQTSDDEADLGDQLNDFFDENSIRPEDVMDIKYSSHYDTIIETHCYSALVIYKIEVEVDED